MHNCNIKIKVFIQPTNKYIQIIKKKYFLLAQKTGTKIKKFFFKQLILQTYLTVSITTKKLSHAFIEIVTKMTYFIKIPNVYCAI